MEQRDDTHIWETVMRVAKMCAARAQRIHRNFVTADDVFQQLNLWALEHWHKIVEWNEQQSLSFKLRRTFNNEAQKYVAKERAAKTGSRPSDAFYYTHELLSELLRDVWTVDGWIAPSVPIEQEYVSKTSKPNEGGNREAMLADVSRCLKALNEHDQTLLRRRFEAGGTDFDVLVVEYQVSEDALRKRVSRALSKLQERLGGEQPYWNSRQYRKVDSNENVRKQILDEE